jgi:hypothetical protein
MNTQTTPQALTDALIKAGFALADTGGGCTAWRMDRADGVQVLITDATDPTSADITSGAMMVGASQYDANGDYVGEVACIESIDATPETVAGIMHALCVQYLYDQGGAALHWQVPMPEAFDAAHDAGAIGMDWESDCYTHPDAVQSGDGLSFHIPHQFQR